MVPKPRLVSNSYESIRYFVRNFFEMTNYDFNQNILGVFKGQTSSACGLNHTQKSHCYLGVGLSH